MTLNRAVQRDLDSFFQKVTSSDYTIREATKGAFSQARSKLNEWGFIRLNEEEAYKLLKCRIELENFSGKTAKAVKQDFHAKIFLLTISATFAHPIEEKVKEEFKADKQRKHDQKINRTNSISMTKDILVGIFIKKQYETALEYFDKIVYNTREIIRPNRKNERKHRQKKLYSMNYKRL